MVCKITGLSIGFYTTTLGSSDVTFSLKTRGEDVLIIGILMNM